MLIMFRLSAFLAMLSFSFAQRDPNIGIQLSVGAPIFSTAWIETGYLFQFSQDHIIYPRYAVQAGVEYGPIAEFLGTDVSVILSVAHAKGGTKTFRSSNDSIQIIGYFERAPVLCWIKLRSSTQLSPYLQFGIGTANTRLINKINIPSTSAFDFSEWQFCFGYGGGMSYELDETLSLELLVHSWLTNMDLIQTVWNSRRGYTGSVAVTMIGLNCLYRM